MKKKIFVLPLCVVFAFCSSSRKAIAPAAPGISNVNVSRNDTMTSAAKASANFTPAQRDFAYKASRDTILNGTWTLDGMVGANGSWSDTQSWNRDSTSTATTTTDTAMTVGTGNTMGSSTSSSSTTRTRGKSKVNRRALYDSAQARLKMNFRDTTMLDTTIQPFKYWTRIPTVTINAARQVFSGNTGCNSMSGSFSFSDKDIRFGRNIATSKMACNQYDETAFLNALKNADNYTVNGGTLELRQGTTKLLSFRKS